jgi:WD40 repeat protein
MLLEATRAAFQKAKSAHAGERFYTFGLYSTEEGGYAVPTCNTEEGLTRVAEKYARKSRRSVEYERDALRWNPADFAYHLEGNEHFAEFERELGRRQRSTWFVLKDCFAVLQQLDKEGMFGIGAERKRTIINLFYGDQGDEQRVQNAQKLNPPTVWKRYADELGMATEITGVYRGLGPRRAEVHGVTISPDGKLLAAASDKTWLFDVATGRQAGTFTGGLADFSPDSTTLAVAADGRIRCWDVRTAKDLGRIAYDDDAVFLCYLCDGGLLVVSMNFDKMTAKARRWTPDGKAERPFSVGKVHGCTPIVLLRDGRTLVVGEPKRAVVYDVPSGKAVRALRLPYDPDAVAISPDARMLAVGIKTFDKEVARPIDILNFATGKRLQQISFNRRAQPDRSPPDSVHNLCFSPHGKVLVSSHDDGSFRLWDTGTWQAVLKLQTTYDHDEIGPMVFTPNGKQLAAVGESTAAMEQAVIVWDVEASLEAVKGGTR